MNLDRQRAETVDQNGLSSRLSMRRSAPLLYSGAGCPMRMPSTGMSSGDNGLGDGAQAVSLASHYGTSIRAVPSGSTTHASNAASGVDSMSGPGSLFLSQGSAKGRYSADTVVPMSEEVYPDPSKYGSNPLAPSMPVPSHESMTGPSGGRSNPLSRTLGIANDWPQGEPDLSREHAPSGGLDAVIPVTGTLDSQLARPEDHLTYRSSIRSNLHKAASQSGSQRQSAASRRATRAEAGGSGSNRRRAVHTSSSGSPPLSPTSGDDFTTRLERIPLLDEGPTLRKSANSLWSPTGSKHRVRAMAARFEKVAQDSSAPRAKYSLSSERGGGSGSGRSVSCPVEVRSSEGSSMESSRGETGETPSVGLGDTGTRDPASERAWERLAAAMESMPPDDLAMLHEIILRQEDLSRGEVSGGRSDESEKEGGEASGRPSRVSGGG